MQRDNRIMDVRRSSKRRQVLGLQDRSKAGEPELLTRAPTDPANQAAGQTALTVPDPDWAGGEPLQPFFEACGGIQPLALTVQRQDNPALSERHMFRQPFCLIGRIADCDLVLPHSQVGYRHVYLQLLSGRWYYLNLARISKTASGRDQPESGWFDVDSQLTVGSHQITRVSLGRGLADGSCQLALTQPAPPVELPAYSVEILNGAPHSREPLVFQFSAPITLIGASPSCEVQLDDSSVSKIHASLVLTPAGLWVVDLLGRGGVLVEGRPAYWSQVLDNTVLEIGRFQLRIRFANSRQTLTNRLETRVAPGYARVLAPGAVTGGGLSEGAVLTLIGQLAEMQNQFFEQSRLQMQWMADMMAHVGRAQQESAKRDMARIQEITSELREIRAQLAGGTVSSPSAPNGARDNRIGHALQPGTDIPPGQARLPSGGTPPAQEVVESEPNAADFGTGVLTDSQAAAAPSLPPATVQDVLPETSPEPTPGPNWATVPGSQPEPIVEAGAAGLEQFPPGAAGVPPEEPRPAPQPAADKAPALRPGRSSADTHAWLTQRMATLSQEHTSLWRRVMNTLTGTPNP